LFFTGDTNTGLFSPGADTVALATAGSNRLHITSAGLVGIGTASPSAALAFADTGGTAGDPNKIALFSAAGIPLYGFGVSAAQLDYVTGESHVFYSRTGSTSTERARIDSSGRLLVGASTSTATHKGRLLVSDLGASLTATGGLEFYSDSSGSGYGHRIHSAFDGASGYYLAFQSRQSSATWTNPMYITAAGNVTIGQHFGSYNLTLANDSAGKPSTNTWTITSDERIKEDIELANLDLCYEAIKNIPLKRFKWKDDVYADEQVRDRRKLGWIAQDVEAVFPKAVGTYEFKYNQVFEETIIPAVEEELDADGNVTTPAQPERIEKGELISEDVIEDCRDLNADQLYAAMYGAVQKLMSKVETLEVRLTAAGIA
jgi:hypothetical protein